MKQLLKRPFLLALIVSLPLWLVLNNYIVAICVALLLAFLLSMIDSIVAIQRRSRPEPDSNDRSGPPTSD